MAYLTTKPIYIIILFVKAMKKRSNSITFITRELGKVKANIIHTTNNTSECLSEHLVI